MSVDACYTQPTTVNVLRRAFSRTEYCVMLADGLRSKATVIRSMFGGDSVAEYCTLISKLN